MEGEKINNLYYLMGDTICGVTNVYTDMDNASLWHKRLGHISEKGLVQLNR